MKRYPQVLGELETMAMVAAGASLARYGDGEFKMAGHDASIKSQEFAPDLSARLRQILDHSGDCLVGIPNIHSATPKAAFWSKHEGFARLLNDKRQYVSSFISRPDSAPWIDTPQYWAALESLWIGQDVTLVRGSQKSLTADDLFGAGNVTEVVAPRQSAWREYASLLERIGTPKRALLCLGPTATVMAVDLAERGVHAVDLGHVGMFLRKRRNGDPLVRTEADKVAE